jgi:uracil-DNA glycosylase
MAENLSLPDLSVPGTPAVGGADLLLALSTIEDSLRTGLALSRPGPELLEALKAAESASMDAPLAAPQATSPAEPPAEATPPALSREDAAAALAQLEAKALACTACRLASTRRRVVFGEGVARPLVLVVGEGPGAEEDNQGLPFVGASGKLLDKMLSSIGLSRGENCYIANIVKCRPPNNREPQPDEKAACTPYLREQIRLLAPRAILCAGRTAAQFLLDTTDGINRLRSRRYSFGGVPLLVTYHPSALLRDETLKRPAWEDLKGLRALLAELDGAS